MYVIGCCLGAGDIVLEGLLDGEDSEAVDLLLVVPSVVSVLKIGSL